MKRLAAFVLMLTATVIASEEKAKDLLTEYYNTVPGHSVIICGAIMGTQRGMSLIKGELLHREMKDTLQERVSDIPKCRKVRVYIEGVDMEVFFLNAYEERLDEHGSYFAPAKGRGVRKGKKLLKQIAQELGFKLE